MQSLLFESANGNLFEVHSGKARSEEMLPRTPRNRCFNASRKKPREKRAADANTEDRKLEPVVSSTRRFAANEQKRGKISKESANAPRPIIREKSPNRTRRGTISADKVQEKDKDLSGKCTTDNKRKRKKISSRSQSSSENALVPSKLISLSLSLLLAALLQAVRCLTDLVEDAFRSVNCDRSGLLQ